LTDAIAGLMAEGGRIRAYEISGYWLNLTGPEELLQASAYRLAETAAGHPGTPGVRPPIVVDPSARIGRCVLGPCVAIGPRCRVEDGAHVEHAILMADAVVERNAVVRHAVIAEDGRAPAGARIEGWPDQAVVVRRGQTA
jgi:NDP-sugar pyrophosphorylase family protein